MLGTQHIEIIDILVYLVYVGDTTHWDHWHSCLSGLCWEHNTLRSLTFLSVWSMLETQHIEIIDILVYLVYVGDTTHWDHWHSCLSGLCWRHNTLRSLTFLSFWSMLGTQQIEIIDILFCLVYVGNTTHLDHWHSFLSGLCWGHNTLRSLTFLSVWSMLGTQHI